MYVKNGEEQLGLRDNYNHKLDHYHLACLYQPGCFSHLLFLLLWVKLALNVIDRPTSFPRQEAWLPAAPKSHNPRFSPLERDCLVFLNYNCKNPMFLSNYLNEYRCIFLRFLFPEIILNLQCTSSVCLEWSSLANFGLLIYCLFTSVRLILVNFCKAHCHFFPLSSPLLHYRLEVRCKTYCSLSLISLSMLRYGTGFLKDFPIFHMICPTPKPRRMEYFRVLLLLSVKFTPCLQYRDVSAFSILPRFDHISLYFLDTSPYPGNWAFPNFAQVLPLFFIIFVKF